MNKLRLAIDSNVFISALLSKKSNPFKVVKFAFENNILLGSDETVETLHATSLHNDI